ncbi:MAG: methyltransferase domain-containing protein [Acidobacteria bacterium]|nr:methyltransferase domain-containing protein [Acidobacteriota bacterium]
MRLLALFDGKTPLRDVVAAYASDAGLDVVRAWLHVETFARDALRQGFLSRDGAVPVPYLGRSAYLQTDRLAELWLHVNDFCNLACAHCLVSSGPDRSQGLPTDRLLDAIDQGVALGVQRFFFTGGEPLARPDALELSRRIVTDHQRELVILTNGTLFRGERLDGLAALAGDRLRVQISLDGASAATNDPIRGAGTFERVTEGIGAAVAAGLRPSVTMVLLKHNLGDVEALIRLAASLGVRNVHLLWPHRRGRVLNGPFASLPGADVILGAVRGARTVARELGVTIDNVEEFRLRLDGRAGVKNDLAGAGWNSLCVYTDGCVYPSASMAGVPELRCGDLQAASLEQIWKESSVCREMRTATVERKPQCRTCTLKFLCGGGDVEHGYWASRSFVGHDPYCDLYKGLAADSFAELASEGRATVQPRSGFDRPVVFRAMGERTLHDEEAIVRTTHSACVLSEEVIERSRGSVREFYGHAAEEPQAELCCPVRPDEADLTHIPREVVERFYGCGSPVTAAGLAPGETMVDLGSGAGIDCFIAAKKVGADGRVYGIDMTDAMLTVANACRPKVAAALGWDVVEFRRGFLEAIPLGDATADVVTSNCVINLSPDKPRVFREMWRVLKDHGRAVVADIVADREVPPKMRADGQLWGECISGALTEEAFLAALERAGFYGVSIVKKTFWREVEGCRFYSVTVRGYKFEKKAGCTYVGQYAIYLGPLKAGIDEEGHLFPRGNPVEVCTDTAAKLSRAPYAGSFAIVDGPAGHVAVDGGEACCTPGSGCC